MPDWVKDRLKEFLSVVLSTAIPAGTSWWAKIIPFVNPQITSDMWPISTIFAVIVGLLSCIYARFPRPPDPPPPKSFVVAGVGFLIAVLGLLALLVLTGDLVDMDAGRESLLVRVAYFALVVGAGAPIGWILSRSF